MIIEKKKKIELIHYAIFVTDSNKKIFLIGKKK